MGQGRQPDARDNPNDARVPVASEPTTAGHAAPGSAPHALSPLVSPTVSGLNPTGGPTTGGTTVLISGTGFTGALSVHFGAAAATFVVVRDAQISATAPAGTGTVQVTVTTPLGTSNGLPYTYAAVPTVTAINPTSGTTTGDTAVVITGTNLSGATAVHFGPATAAFTVNSGTRITATAPAGTGSVQVTVTTPGGTSNGLPYSYVAAPTVTAINPTSGPTTGGTTVTVTGTGFTGTTAVHFGPATATFTVTSSTRITATAPPGTGTLQVTVTTPGGTSVEPVFFSYTATVPVPTISSINPTAGRAAGDDTVTIIGTNLAGATGVHFGPALASFTPVSSTQIVASTPPGSGTVQVTVATPGGTSNGVPYTYVPAPAISTVVPGSGPTTGGTTVVITGTGFTATTEVAFGANPAGFTVNSDTRLTVTTPAGTAGPVQVTVTATGGTSNAVSYFYLVAPSLGAVTPHQGPTSGGNTVTVTGTGFTTATSVHFGLMAASFTVVDDSTITATTPPGTGTVQVTVTSPGGTSTTGPAGSYSYLAAPTVVDLTPDLGSTNGGTSVLLTGTHLTFTSRVAFGGAPAPFTVLSDTRVVATAPPHPAGPVSVTVTTPGGTNAGITYTYVAPPG